MTQSDPEYPRTQAYGAIPPQPQQEAPVKKRRRIFPWFYLLVNILFLVWIIVGASSGGDASNCGTLSQQACNDAQNVGKGIGAALIIGLWVAFDVIVGFIYLMFRLAGRKR